MCSCRNIRSKCCYTRLFANLQGNYSSLSSSDCTQAARNIIKPYSWISWVFASETYGWDSYDDYKMRRSKNVSSTWFWLKESRKKKIHSPAHSSIVSAHYTPSIVFICWDNPSFPRLPQRWGVGIYVERETKHPFWLQLSYGDC